MAEWNLISSISDTSWVKAFDKKSFFVKTLFSLITSLVAFYIYVCLCM